MERPRVPGFDGPGLRQKGRQVGTALDEFADGIRAEDVHRTSADIERGPKVKVAMRLEVGIPLHPRQPVVVDFSPRIGEAPQILQHHLLREESLDLRHHPVRPRRNQRESRAGRGDLVPEFDSDHRGRIPHHVGDMPSAIKVYPEALLRREPFAHILRRGIVDRALERHDALLGILVGRRRPRSTEVLEGELEPDAKLLGPFHQPFQILGRPRRIDARLLGHHLHERTREPDAHEVAAILGEGRHPSVKKRAGLNGRTLQPVKADVASNRHPGLSIGIRQITTVNL